MYYPFFESHLLTMKMKKYKEVSELIQHKITNTFENSKIQMWQAITWVKAFRQDLYTFKMSQN